MERGDPDDRDQGSAVRVRLSRRELRPAEHPQGRSLRGERGRAGSPPRPTPVIQPMSRTWMIYGANGYTGRLAARVAADRRLRPILAGRHADAVRSLADGLGCESRVF